MTLLSLLKGPPLDPCGNVADGNQQSQETKGRQKQCGSRAHSSGTWWRFDPGKRAKALETLRFVGLQYAANSPAVSLPQGQQQRLLEIARALSLDPQVLLLDEPHAGLNIVETERLMDVIRALHQRGLTVILVEHEMRVVMALAQRITVLNFGKLLVEGTPAEIQSSPAAIEAYLGSRRGQRYHA